MSNLYILQIVNGFSWVLGIILFIIATVFLDDVVSNTHSLNTNNSIFPSNSSVEVHELDVGMKYTSPVAVQMFTILAILLSLYQVGFTTVLFRRLEESEVGKLWWKVHLLFAVITIIVFTVVVEQNAHTISGSKGSAIVGFSMIDCIFCFATSIFVYIVARRGSFQDY